MAADGSSDQSNGHEDLEEEQPSKRRSAIKALVQDFEPTWFAVTMNAGIISILLNQLPYQFNGLSVLSTIAFVIEFVLFIVFSVIMIARFVWFRGQAYREITDSVGDLGLLGCWAITWLTMSSLVSLIVSNAYWGGHAFTIVAYVMWWIGVAWMYLYFLFVFIIIIRRQKGSEIAGGNMPIPILIPVVGIATSATTGGLISIYSNQISARMAVPVMIVSFLMIGIAVFMSTFLYTLELHQLMVNGWPPQPDSSPLIFIFIGPLAQSAAALQLLGQAASTYGRFGGYHQGTFLQNSAASPLNTACTMLALLLAGMSATWAFLAVYVMVEPAYQKTLKWSPSWNSIIFPLGTLTTATTQFAIEMDSPAWRTITTALVIILVILFFVNAAFTIYKIAKGELLIVRDDPRVEEKSD